MEDKIKAYISQLEQEYNMEVLLACETGSRAWGFPSPDSDFDVRIIYKHPKNWYLSLNEEKDTIEHFFENNEIDISGWDIRKSLRLLWKSNPPLLERIQSPICYKVDHEFLNGITDLAKTSYSKIATMHHYLSMAKKTLAEVTENEQYKLKKFFYALRASIACLWILEKDSIPPIEFGQMINELNLDEKLVNRIHALIALKATINEDYLHQNEQELIQFMKNCISRSEIASRNLPAGNANMNQFNQFFINMLD